MATTLVFLRELVSKSKMPALRPPNLYKEHQRCLAASMATQLHPPIPELFVLPLSCDEVEMHMRRLHHVIHFVEELTGKTSP